MTEKMRCKLIVLYMLEAVNGTLSMAQISGFLLRSDDNSEGMDYFSFQEMMEELRDAGLVSVEKQYQRTLFTITPAGQEALYYYQTRIPVSLEEKILTYLEAHEIEIREHLTVYSDLYKDEGEGYVAVCQLRDRSRHIADLRLSVADKQQAAAVCRQWKAHYAELYEILMDTLVQ